MIAVQEASARFSMFINKPISSPIEWQNSLREFYILEKWTMNAIQEAFSRFFMLIIIYWIHIFSFLGIFKWNFRGWWRKKAAPRWSGTSKKGIHDLGELKRNRGRGGGGWAVDGRKRKWTENKISISSKTNVPPPLNKTLFFSAVTQYYSLKGVNCDTKYYFFNKMPWVNTHHENFWIPESDFKNLKVLEILLILDIWFFLLKNL